MRNGNKNGNGIKIMFVLLLLSVAFMGTRVYALTEYVKANTMEIETETNETEKLDVGIYEYKDTYYIFCIVTECNDETFTVVAPNGSLQEFYLMDDYPIDDNGNPCFESVVFKVLEQCYEDYDAWIVIDVM